MLKVSANTEKRLNEGPRLQRKTARHHLQTKKTTTENARKVQVFAPLVVANQLWRAKQDEDACFGLSSPWSFPSRSGILLHAVVLTFCSQRSHLINLFAFRPPTGVDARKKHRFDLCVCVCFLPIHSGHQVRWTYQPGSHRRKVTQDF